MEAVMTAGAALLPVYGKPLGEPAPVDEAACYVASYAAKVAESAATAAGAEPAESARAALDAFAFVRDIQVATGADDIGAMLERDLEALCRVAARRGWGDATPVPPSVFGRLSEGERGQGGSSGRDVAT